MGTAGCRGTVSLGRLIYFSGSDHRRLERVSSEPDTDSETTDRPATDNSTWRVTRPHRPHTCSRNVSQFQDIEENDVIFSKISFLGLELR